MTDDTRDIAVEARTDIKNILKMLQSHIDRTEAHRDGLRVELEAVNDKLADHNDLIQQLKGARLAVTGGVALVTTFVGIGGAKIMGLFR